MWNISKEWTPEERLQVIYDIALALYEDIHRSGRADAERAEHDALRICRIARESAANLEADRARLLEGLKWS